MAELCSSSDMDVSSATHGKPEKICLVCGDKALGYNFNAVSCESCKAFFRRNAHKTIRGRCEGRCEVTVESRSFCKRCRLAKCFTVGMRKDMILNEEQKKQRKQKIITNKLRRQGQIPQGTILPDGAGPYDTHLPHSYLKPGSPRELAMMELAGTGPGKHGNDYLHQSQYRLSSHLMGRYAYPSHDLYNVGTEYPINMGKSMSAGSSPSRSACGAGLGYPQESSLSPTSSSSSSLQQEEYYNNQHHHHHHQQQQQQHNYLNHHHHLSQQQQQQRQQQHLSHQDRQFHNRQNVTMKQERYGHIEQDRIHSKKMVENVYHRQQVIHTPGVPSIHIKQEVPDSITDSPEASSTHSPPLTKYSPQAHAHPHSHSPQFPRDFSHRGSLSRSSSCHSNAADYNNVDSKSHLYQSPQKATPPCPISPSSSTSPRLNSGCAANCSESSLSSSGTTSSTTGGAPTNPTSISTTDNNNGIKDNAPTTAQPTNCQVMPWSESQDLVNSAIDNLGVDGARDIREMMHAMEVGTFFDGNRSIRAIPNTPEEFVNTAELFVRKVIKFAKNLTSFKTLLRGDQVGLLKSSVVDIMMLRSAINYDPFSETWNLNTKGCMAQGANQAAGARISAEILKSGSENTKKLFMTYSKFIKSLMSTVHGDRVILELLILISLFSADRLPLEKHNEIQAIQEHYAYLLQCYVSNRFDSEETLFARIIMKLADLRDINEIHSDMLLHMKVDELDPLLVEIFELPPPSESGEDEGEEKKKQEQPPKSKMAKADITSNPDTNISPEKIQQSNSVTTSEYRSDTPKEGTACANLPRKGIQQQQGCGDGSLQTSSTLPALSRHRQMTSMKYPGPYEDITLEKQNSRGQTPSLSPTSTLSPTQHRSPTSQTQFSPAPELSKLRLNSFSASSQDENSSHLLTPEAQMMSSPSPSLDTPPVMTSMSPGSTSTDNPFSPSLSKYPCHR